MSDYFAASHRDELLGENRQLKERIKRLEAVTNDPHALWANWLRGDVKLPEGIGDVRQYQDRIKRLEEAGDAVAAIIGPPGSAHWADENQVDAAWTNWTEAKEAK